MNKTDVAVVALAVGAVAAVYFFKPKQEVAAGWVTVSDFDGETISYQPSSAVRRGDLVEVWSASETSSEANKPYRSSRTLHYIQCSPPRMGFKDVVLYDAPGAVGNVLARASLPDAEVQLLGVVPGSPGEAILRGVCQR